MFASNEENEKISGLFDGQEILCVHVYEDERDGYLVVGGNSKEI